MFKIRNTYYDPEKQRTSWIRIGIIIAIIVFVFIVILLVFGNREDKRYSLLVSSAKTYLNKNSNAFPSSLGQCVTLDIDEIRNNIDITKFKSCKTDKTYVKICKIDIDKYQYTPVLNCKNEITKFDKYHDGSVNNLKQDNSDIKVSFLPERLTIGTRNYYPSNIKDSSKVDTYYATNPTPEYIFHDLAADAYKWYVESEQKVFYKDGTYSSTQPEGYTEKLSESSKKYASVTKLKTESYRTISEAKVYSTEKVAYPYKYTCGNPNGSGGRVTNSSIVCQLRPDDMKGTYEVFYTCDGTNTVPENTVCQQRSNWVLTNCYNDKQSQKGTTADGYSYSRQILTGDTCISAFGYSVVDKVWKWYKIDKIRSYLPSQSKTADGEITYYVESPTVKAVKDESTKTKTYKYYKVIDADKVKEEWYSISDVALTEQELIDKINELGYNVNSLDDINKLDDIQYKIKISYCDRK